MDKLNVHISIKIAIAAALKMVSSTGKAAIHLPMGELTSVNFRPVKFRVKANEFMLMAIDMRAVFKPENLKALALILPKEVIAMKAHSKQVIPMVKEQ
jgi:hypothetical protein